MPAGGGQKKSTRVGGRKKGTLKESHNTINRGNEKGTRKHGHHKLAQKDPSSRQAGARMPWANLGEDEGGGGQKKVHVIIGHIRTSNKRRKPKIV